IDGVKIKERPTIAHLGVRQSKHSVLRIRRRKLEEFRNEREIRIYHLQTGWQSVFERYEILKLARVQSVGDEQLITQLKRSFGSAYSVGIGQVFDHAFDPKPAVDAVGIDFVGRVFGLQQKRECALVEAFDRQVAIQPVVK